MIGAVPRRGEGAGADGRTEDSLFGVLTIRRCLPLVDLAYHDLFMIALITLILLLGGFICLTLAVFKENDRIRLVAAGLACWLLAELVQRVYELLILQP